MLKRFGLLCVLTTIALPAGAGNGHLLHGVGVINSSMGGSGTGLPTDVISALHLNPALLTRLEGTRVAISTELFEDDLSMTTTGPGFPANHTTDSDGDLGILPALGWSHNPGQRWAVGFGLLGGAGFRTNWPTDPSSFLLNAQPIGFGPLNTELQVSKVPLAFAYQVNPKLSIGGSLNWYISRLIINPLPVVPPTCNGFDQNGNPIDQIAPADATGTNCFRPQTLVPVTEFAFSVQAGLYYEINSQWSFGFSYTSEQDTDPYTWNSFFTNPNILSGPQAFGSPREIAIDLDQPELWTAGVGFRPSPRLKLAFDVKWVGYSGTDGIGGTGGINAQQVLVSIGWDDIYAYMFGLEYEANPKLRWRFGLNFNDSPIREEVTINSGGTPSVFEEHYTIGLSFAVTPKFDIDLGAYYTPENDKTGPFINGNNQPIPNTSVTLTNSIIAGLIGFSFHF